MYELFTIDSEALGWGAGSPVTTETARIALAESTGTSSPALLFGNAPIPVETRR